jgi:hypothetical protein
MFLPMAAGGLRNDGTELVVLALAVLYSAGAMTDADAESATSTPQRAQHGDGGRSHPAAIPASVRRHARAPRKRA